MSNPFSLPDAKTKKNEEVEDNPFLRPDDFSSESFPASEAPSLDTQTRKEFEDRPFWKKVFVSDQEYQSLFESGAFADKYWTLPINPTALKQGLIEGGIRSAPQVLATAATGPAGVGTQILGSFLGAATGEAGVQSSRGESRPGQVLAAGAQNAIPASKFGSFLKDAPVDMAIQGAASIPAANMASYLDSGGPAFQSGEEALKYAGINAGFAGGAKMVEGAARQVGGIVANRNNARAMADQAGLPMGEMPAEVLNPNAAQDIANLEAKGFLKPNIPKRENLKGRIADRLSGVFAGESGKFPETGHITELVGSRVRELTEARVGIESLQEMRRKAGLGVAEAEAVLKAAQNDPTLAISPAFIEQKKAGLSYNLISSLEADMALANRIARENLAAGMMPTGGGKTPGEVAASLAELSETVSQSIKTTASKYYDSIDNTRKVFSVAPILAAVEKAAEITPHRVAIKDLKKTLEAAGADGLLTFAQAKEIKTKLGNEITYGFNATSEDKALSDQYRAISDSITKDAERGLTPQDAQSVKIANGLWKDYVDIYGTTAMKAMRNKETSASAINELINDLSNEGTSGPKWESWRNAIGKLKTTAPAYADALNSNLGAIIADRVKAKATKIDPVTNRQFVDFEDISKSLLELNKYGAATELGIATPSMIREMALLSKKHKGLELSRQDAESLLSSSAWRSALVEDKSLYDVVDHFVSSKKAAAGLTMAQALQSVGKVQEAKEALNAARKVASDANINLDAFIAGKKGVTDSPLAKAIADIRGGKATEAEAVVSAILDPQFAKSVTNKQVVSLIDGMLSHKVNGMPDPQMIEAAGMIQRRYLGDLLGSWVKDGKIDPKKVSGFFPVGAKDMENPSYRFLAVAGRNKDVQKRVNDMLPLVRQMANTEVSQTPTRNFGLPTAVVDALKAGKVNTAAYLIQNPSVFTNLVSGQGTASGLRTMDDLIKAVGEARAIAILRADDQLRRELE